MLTFKRAFVAAVLVLTILFLSTRNHRAITQIPSIDLTTGTETLSGDKSRTGFKPSTPVSTNPSPKNGGSRNKKTSAQRPLIDTTSLSLPEKLAYQFPYDLETKFPAYIWQTWKTTPDSGDFNEEFRPAEASWSDQHPGFIHEVITDKVAVHLMTHLYAAVPEVLEAYLALPLPILKADFFRYLILLARGGIYTDIDTHALKSALEWVPSHVPRTSIGLVIGIEADPDRPDWKDWYSRRIQFCQWTIQAKPGHPVLREIVTFITKETLRRKKEGTLKTFADDKVIEFTGPAAWTDIIFDFFNDDRFFDMDKDATKRSNITWRDFTGMTAPKKVGDVVVLPITCFSPGVQQMGAGDYDDPMAYVKHEFEGTWKPEHLRHIGEVFDEHGQMITDVMKKEMEAAASAGKAPKE